MKNKILMVSVFAFTVIAFLATSKILISNPKECIILFFAVAWVEMFCRINNYRERRTRNAH